MEKPKKSNKELRWPHDCWETVEQIGRTQWAYIVEHPKDKYQFCTDCHDDAKSVCKQLNVQNERIKGLIKILAKVKNELTDSLGQVSHWQTAEEKMQEVVDLVDTEL